MASQPVPEKFHKQVQLLEQRPQLISLMTIIRNKKSPRVDFIFYSDRIIRLLVEEGLNHLPTISRKVITPVDTSFAGKMF
ncbi:Uracil phosphoribosyltransferase, synthesizes UMP from uracil [Entomophthora muscae]|uniref:Uracil phosphoribosyltransferase, synthesizes UMP from uracil n=2 Tax=Entomophthora muscae TaxID=34485 RepID=A0ACC2TMN1_9FUNG|nr:Uracil phosphoribosyltransferase, synthesizes UMP from uracil [Entomophthora muscae]KAJ9084292.1 Uracil phosphoribosyltransferase, synthesizes UMP from uracil [Entomophthora muscae]